MESSKEQSTGVEAALPPLTAHEERIYNSLATKMQYFHTGLQAEYEECYELADGKFTKRGMSLSQYLGFVDQFRMHITMHHDIEEAHVFPTLAKRMPEFRPNERHKNSHKLIHDGLDKIEEAVKRFKEDNSSYNPVEMREAFDSFREPLYRHLAEEVQDLSAENMRKYWSVAEVRRLGF
ncbi:SubName: Full=Uncharacterized protein {ECO:0000313/EMBL:CCA66418.1} [Serendipita indica DSM 11827]|uniref:Hemerythrin-like domain-containing protein n=1 Tax=Serendipita indica (strain DSM 11827) TaxID=1109443 RepID=G4T4T0_SERID|nr:SubName: Full=Uncharacterized protein {ECO:0000313/EMBL:CCA66418.1} [Serendipita indica DSM 11827]CCA66418.1 hypothetical protein PIIN_00104 [Serendipita indica DSM 11827]